MELTYQRVHSGYGMAGRTPYGCCVALGFSGSGYVGLMPVVLLDNIVLDWSCQGLPAVNDVLAHYSMTSGNGARLFYPTASSLRPSSLPSSSSQARSGWGIIPNTLNASFATPAIWSIEPLGLYASFSAPVGLQ
jgi:hypothetical protein